MRKPAADLTRVRCRYSKIICRCLSLQSFPVLSLKRYTPNLYSDLGLAQLFFSFFSQSHHRIPFDPRTIALSSSSLHHCHSPSNSPAIVISPRAALPTANLYSGRIHLSSGSLRSAAVSSARSPTSRTCSWRLSVSLSKPFSISSGFEFWKKKSHLY